tara:strand:+ start:22214 stop:22573 length:360 start_codon:yes stop_codon:yes gene_type:complete
MTVTETARQFVRTKLNDEYVKMDIGEGGGSTDISMNSLFASITSAASQPLLSATRSVSTDNQIEFKTTVSGSTYAGYTIREVGILNAGGTGMLTRIPIDPIGPLENTKTYEIVVIMEVE